MADVASIAMFRALVGSTVHPDRRERVYATGLPPPLICTHCRNVGHPEHAHHVSACPVIAANVCGVCHRPGHLPSRCLFVPTRPLDEVQPRERAPLPRESAKEPPPPPRFPPPLFPLPQGVQQPRLDPDVLARLQRTMSSLPSGTRAAAPAYVPPDTLRTMARRTTSAGEMAYGAAAAAAEGRRWSPPRNRSRSRSRSPPRSRSRALSRSGGRARSRGARSRTRSRGGRRSRDARGSPRHYRRTRRSPSTRERSSTKRRGRRRDSSRSRPRDDHIQHRRRSRSRRRSRHRSRSLTRHQRRRSVTPLRRGALMEKPLEPWTPSAAPYVPPEEAYSPTAAIRASAFGDRYQSSILPDM